MISNNISGWGGAFKVMLPDFEGLENCKQFFVMDIIIQLWGSKGMGMKGDQVDLTIIGKDRKNCTQCIVGGISFNNNLSIGNPLCKHRYRSESLLKLIECLMTLLREIPSSIFVGEAG